MEKNRFTVELSEEQWLRNIIEDFILQSPENHFRSPGGEKAFDKPLVGFSSGADPIYNQFKDVIGRFHWTPMEIYQRTFPEEAVQPDELIIISWILPQTKATKTDNRMQTAFPCERWVRARTFGEDVNVKLREKVAKELNKNGYPALAPMLSKLWQEQLSEKYGFASTWSERHAAHACGLGTFGLCDGLITPLGKAMRTGSVIARIQIPSLKRPYTDHHAYCLFYAKGLCGTCIKRCPADAISEAGHDKEKCRRYLRNEVKDFIKTEYGFEGKGCGICQSKVPCESKIPIKLS